MTPPADRSGAENGLDRTARASKAAQAAPKKRGRPMGIPNQITRDIKELIMRRGKPVELLCDVARGVKIRVGPQAGPAEPEWVYPDLETRLHAARTLLGKICPDMRAVELSGPEGAPLAEPIDQQPCREH